MFTKAEAGDESAKKLTLTYCITMRHKKGWPGFGMIQSAGQIQTLLLSS